MADEGGRLRQEAEHALLKAIAKAAKAGDAEAASGLADALATVRGDNREPTSQSAVGFQMDPAEDRWEQA